MTCSALRLTPRDNPVVKPLLILLGSFKGFRVLMTLQPPTHQIRHQSFALLIIPLVGSKSCQTSPTHGCLLLHQGSRLVGVTGLVSFYTENAASTHMRLHVNDSPA